ncbi:Oidioi.mRNA.OKI2018_I69.chr1.g2065.t1.cds [Oikopleura dioica]|uniref:Oidioi.mRNA.OKI2018_I69.chr1.g2065.t1.cds n=1 Tax=Oikopleura dioica TaxID=34765 RepID=A0ABN7SRM5_OIKDI|nr:Oidioi.mRNA.OKI2018_I69.chr1.g2065.t1.cds [Oikopleura dioica]
MNELNFNPFEREIMFHVSTLLPTDPDDKQQVAKKRHLGNDVVAVVFQERNTPFCPSLMQTKVTHCYVVVQPMDVDGPTQYKISVCCRKDVPDFGPKLPEPPVFKSGACFRKYLLCKLINAENACYSSCEFNMLRRRNRSDLIETLYNELSAASDGMSTKRSHIQRPLHTNKSFFDAIQQNNKMRRLSSHSSENSSESTLVREQNRKIIRRSGIRRELVQKYNLQKMQNDSGISSKDSSSENESPAEEISDAITDRDMDSIKSEILSFDFNHEKTSLKSFSPSLGTLSMQINSIKIGGSRKEFETKRDSLGEEIFIDDLVTSVTNATTLTTFSSADLKPNRAPLPLPKSESSALTTVSSVTPVSFPSVPKTLAPLKTTATATVATVPTSSAKPQISTTASASIKSTTGQVQTASTTVKPAPITQSSKSPSTVTVIPKKEQITEASMKEIKTTTSTPVNYDYGYEPSYYYENEVSVVSEVSSVASLPAQTRKLPPGAVPMPHMQAW